MKETHWRRWCLAVFAVTFLLHFPPIDNYLDNDDAFNYVLESERLLDGNGSAWLDGGSYLAHQNLLRLSASLTWVARYALFDLWMPAWHFPSILFHALNALLTILVCARLGASKPVALLAGALFGLSPTHAHVVAWIGGTFDLMCGMFILLTLLCFMDKKTKWGVLCLIGAMTSKETGALLGPCLALYVLVYERKHGLRPAIKRLMPYAVAAIAVAGLRGLQIATMGSIDQAGLPARSLGFDVNALFVAGPLALVHAMFAPLKYLVPLDPSIFGLICGGGLVVAMALTQVWRSPNTGFAIGAGYLLLVPVLMLREMDIPMTLEELLHHPRYLYLPQLGAALILPSVVLGLGTVTSKLRIVLGVFATLGSFGAAGLDVLTLTEPTPAVRTVAEHILKHDPKPGSRVYVLCNVHDEPVLRLLTSRWLHEHKKATYHLVLRGSQRILERDPLRTDGLDFKDFYIRTNPKRFDSSMVSTERQDTVFLLSHGGPDGNHKVSQVEPLPHTSPGRTQPLETKWQKLPPQIHIKMRNSAAGREFTVDRRTDRPGGIHHRAFLHSDRLDIPANQVHAIQIDYTATGLRPRPHDRRYTWGYFELHWRTDGGEEDSSFVSFRIQADAQRQQATLRLDIDPVWQRAGTIEWLGVTPINDVGALVLHGITINYKK